MVLKFVETGCVPDAPEDALALRVACGLFHDALSLNRICPHRFRLPATPLAAAEAEGREVSMPRILECIKAAQAADAPLMIEATGGLLVPLARAGDSIITNLDLTHILKMPMVLMARTGLNTLNHTTLSIET